MAMVVMIGGHVVVSHNGKEWLLHQLWLECDITAIKVVADGIRVSHVRLTSAVEPPRTCTVRGVHSQRLGYREIHRLSHRNRQALHCRRPLRIHINVVQINYKDHKSIEERFHFSIGQVHINTKILI